MKLSVIMAVYNIGSAEILNSAVGSVLRQSFSEFEFIICDDASNNGTSLWLQEYAKRDSRIRILRNQQNEKLATSLNKCIAAARGTFLARQDADDISDPTRLEKQLRFLQ